MLAICLLLVVGASFIASLLQKDFGRVQVTGLRLPTQNGQWLAADLFRPRTATAENPAPLVIVVPGFQRSKETQANIAMELARRGLVVISIDPYAQGNSSSSMQRRAATTEGYGLFAVVEYVANTPNLNYVDKSLIGATGHSAGGNAVLQGARFFGREADRAKKPSKLHAVFVSGYVLTLTDNVLRHVRSHIGVSYALYDEGAYRNELKNGDMRRAPEALRTVQSGLAEGEAMPEEIEMGKYYGRDRDRTLRVIHNEKLLHPFQPYSIEATSAQLDFFGRVFDTDFGGRPHTDQVWYWKELFTLIALLSAFVALVPFARLILHHVPYFSVLMHPLPAPLPKPQGRGKVIFWVLLTTGALIACFSYIPMTELSQQLFKAATAREQTWFFPQRMNNGVMLWALYNGLVGFVLFFIGYRFHGKAKGVTPAQWGTSITLTELKRTVLLAVGLFLSFFLLLSTIYSVFHVDYRFLFIGVRVFQPALIPLLLVYAPMFFVFFLSNSLRVNGAMRFAGQPEGRSMLLAGVANALGLFFIVLVQYVTFAVTGTVHWTDGWLYINLLFAVVPIMFVLPFYHRLFFNMTGRIYLGPLTMCLIFIMIMVSNTVCYLPF